METMMRKVPATELPMRLRNDGFGVGGGGGVSCSAYNRGVFSSAMMRMSSKRGAASQGLLVAVAAWPEEAPREEKVGDEVQ